MQMRCHIGPADLPLARKERNEKGNSDGPAQIAHEVADPRDLVIICLPHPDVRQRADRDEDQRNPDHAEDSHQHHVLEIDIGRDTHHPEQAR